MPSDFCYIVTKGANGKNTIHSRTIIIEDRFTEKISHRLSKELIHDINSNISNGKLNGNVADGLYHYYLTERIFNLNLFYSLLKHIKHLDNDISSKLSLPTLYCCKKLPNAFSRQYFLKFAFDHIEANPHSYLDFWYSNKLNDNKPIQYSNDPKGFHLNKWQEQFPLFFNYMAQYIIPVYEWCFLNMLLESLENKKQDKNPEDHFIILNEAMNLLTAYMNNNFKAIQEPIALPEMDLLSIVQEHKNYEELLELPKETIQMTINSFFNSSEDLELNLHPLNPSFFKKDRHTTGQTNVGSIRKFYLNLVRNTYLMPDDNLGNPQN